MCACARARGRVCMCVKGTYFLCVSVSVCSPSIASPARLRIAEATDFLETKMVVRETEVDRKSHNV